VIKEITPIGPAETHVSGLSPPLMPKMFNKQCILCISSINSHRSSFELDADEKVTRIVQIGET
jgi:hypothetical protein